MNIEDIKHLVGMVMEETEGASSYKKCAKKYEDTFPEISKMFTTMADQEQHHGMMLLDMLKLIRSKETDITKQTVLDFVIDLSIEQLNK